tara:strand:- start:1560 stop:2171 length:612 start_codon:yes stop_codon:yes gene_type:complete
MSNKIINIEPRECKGTILKVPNSNGQTIIQYIFDNGEKIIHPYNGWTKWKNVFEYGVLCNSTMYGGDCYGGSFCNTSGYLSPCKYHRHHLVCSNCFFASCACCGIDEENDDWCPRCNKAIMSCTEELCYEIDDKKIANNVYRRGKLRFEDLSTTQFCEQCGVNKAEQYCDNCDTLLCSKCSELYYGNRDNYETRIVCEICQCL